MGRAAQPLQAATSGSVAGKDEKMQHDRVTEHRSMHDCLKDDGWALPLWRALSLSLSLSLSPGLPPSLPPSLSSTHPLMHSSLILSRSLSRSFAQSLKRSPRRHAVTLAPPTGSLAQFTQPKAHICHMLSRTNTTNRTTSSRTHAHTRTRCRRPVWRRRWSSCRGPARRPGPSGCAHTPRPGPLRRE
jgi:hypothetical protein